MIVLGAALGSGGGAGGSADSGDGNGNGGGGETPDPPGPSEDQYAGEEIGTFTRENYGILVANPKEHEGAEVDVTGQLLDNPESRGDLVAFQMWADPVKVDWSTIVSADEGSLALRTDDYVHVRGTVVGEIKGKNAFGGTVSAVSVEADEVEKVDAMAALNPTQETVEVGQTRTVEGFSITLERLEFAGRYTRAHVTARNDGDKTAKLDLYRSKMTQGSKRVGQTDPYEYNLPKPRSGLGPGEQTEGVVNFRRADPAQPLQVSFAWERGGYMSDKPEPVVFEVAP